MTDHAMTGHTPGPWDYQATAGNHDFSVYGGETGRDIALVRDFDEANARLIAAAPDLLAFAQYVAARPPKASRGMTAREELEHITEMARAAIEAAEGGGA